MIICKMCNSKHEGDICPFCDCVWYGDYQEFIDKEMDNYFI